MCPDKHVDSQLASADLIVVLDISGRICDIGSPKDLQTREGYDFLIRENHNNEIEPADAPELAIPRIITNDDADADINPKKGGSGDWGLYKYYADAAGRTRSIIFLTIALVFSGSYSFQREAPHLT